MKIATKAALLSGTVLPGAGQIYLKRYLRGFVMLFVSLAGLGVVIAAMVSAVWESLNKIQVDVEALDPDMIMNISRSYSLHYSLYVNIASMVILCCWVFSIVDAYSLGRKEDIRAEKEKKGEQTSQP